MYSIKDFMKRIICFITIFWTIIPALSAQKLWEKGFIVQLQGDTLHGEVAYTWTYSPSEIYFRQNGKEASQYAPNQIKAFGFDDIKEYYRSGKITVEKRNSVKLQVIYLNKLETMEKFVFLKLVMDVDPISLYVYEDLLRNYYALQKNDSLTTLKYYRYLVNSEVGNIRELNEFRHQLFTTLDCPPIFEQLQTIQYKEYDLKKILLGYCKAKGIPYTPPTQKNPIECKIFLGASVNSLKYYQSSLSSDFSEFNTSRIGMVGLGAEIYFNPNSRTWSVYSELGLLAGARHNQTKELTSSIIEEYDIKFSLLRLALMLRNQPVSASPAKFVWGLGLTTGLPVSGYVRENWNSFILGSELTDKKIKSMVGLIASVGIRYKKYTLDLRAENYQITVKRYNSFAKGISTGLCVGYVF